MSKISGRPSSIAIPLRGFGPCCARCCHFRGGLLAPVVGTCALRDGEGEPRPVVLGHLQTCDSFYSARRAFERSGNLVTQEG